jgi:nucleoside 2-deoxyribosyltransferase
MGAEAGTDGDGGVKVYLCGPINGCTDDEATGWREQAKKYLAGETYDPMVRDYRGRELEPGIAKEIVENDKLDIQECDAILVMYEKPSVGTSMEALFAHQLGKLIVLVDRSGKPLSPWLIYHSTKAFPTLAEATAFINRWATGERY